VKRQKALADTPLNSAQLRSPDDFNGRARPTFLPVDNLWITPPDHLFFPNNSDLTDLAACIF